jgi:AraC-like DNA-binding protein
LLHAHYASHVYERHSHDVYGFGLTLGGAHAFNCRGASHVSTTGAVMALNPDDPHDGHACIPEGYTYRMIYVEPHRLADILADASGRACGLPLFDQPLIEDPVCAAFVEALHRAYAEPSAALEQESALMEAVLAFWTRHARGRPAGPAAGLGGADVARARDYLHAHIADNVRVQDLARVTGLSRFHLSRRFQRCYGLPPHAYLLRLRLAEARRRLAQGEAPIEVASATGFADQSHLYKRFKGTYGITPGHFQRATWRDRPDAGPGAGLHRPSPGNGMRERGT